MQIETVEAAALPDTDPVAMPVRSTDPGPFPAGTVDPTVEGHSRPTLGPNGVAYPDLDDGLPHLS